MPLDKIDDPPNAFSTIQIDKLHPSLVSVDTLSNNGITSKTANTDKAATYRNGTNQNLPLHTFLSVVN